MRDMDPRVAALLIVIGVALIGIFNFSRSIGAAFQVTLGAVIWSAIALGVLTALFWTPLRPRFSVYASLAAALIWPSWWKVLDSIAHGGADPDTLAFRFPQEVWWNSNAFKYGIEAGLIALVVFLVIRQIRDPYGY